MASQVQGIPTLDRSGSDRPAHGGRDRALQRGSFIVALVVLGWSIVEVINLGLNHTTGAELYGVLTAALAVAAGAATLVLLGRAGASRSTLAIVASVAVLVLWALIAVAGIAGTVAHVIGPVAGHGPMDLRPRPVAAPLIFTVLGALGGGALFVGRRSSRQIERNH